MDGSRARLALPALVAGAVPLASALVIATASGTTAGAFDGTWRGVLLAIMPFAAVAALAARADWARPGFGLASGVGLVLMVGAWGWATAGALQAVPEGSPLSLAIGVVLFAALPILVLSVMVTVLVVRGLFAGGPS